MRTRSGQGHVQPNGVSLRTDVSIRVRGEAVSTRAEVVGDGTERAEEALRVLGGFEALEHTLSLAGRQVGVLCPIVQSLWRRCSLRGSTRLTAGT